MTSMKWVDERRLAEVRGTDDGTSDVTDHECLDAADATLQNPVDLSVVGEPLQVHSNGRQVDLVLLQSLAAATVQLDGPLK